MAPLCPFSSSNNNLICQRNTSFGYLQIRHFINAQTLPLEDVPKYSTRETFLMDRKSTSHLIPSFYLLLHSFTSDNMYNVIRKWEKDLDNEYIEDDWHEAFDCVRAVLTCNRLKETQYKIQHRLHTTPAMRNTIDRSISPLCVKCHREQGNYFHLFWKRRYIQRFWSRVAKELSSIFQVRIKKDPGLFILGLPSKEVTLPSLKYRLFDKLLLLARKCILIKWIK